MALENLTLFELHLENSRFGPSFGDDEPELADGSELADDEADGSRFGPLFGLLFVAAIAAAVGYRRYRSGGDGDSGGEQITIESAAEQ